MRCLRSIAIAGPLTLLPHASPAQAPRLLETRYPARGELTAADPTRPNGAHEDQYYFHAWAGDSVTLTVESDAFDTFLRVLAPDGSEQTNDDVAPGNTDSAITFVPGAAGTFRAGVTSFAPGRTGSYVLRLAIEAPPGASPPAPPPPAPAAPRAVSIAYGETRRGTLEAGDQESAAGRYEDHGEFQGTAGDRVTIRLDSTAFDPALRLITPSGRESADDDSGPGQNAALTLVLAESGTHTLVVTTYAPGATGAYTLTLEGGAAPPAPGDLLSVSRSVHGSLGPGDGTTPSGGFVDTHHFEGQAGQAVTVRAQSSDMDTVLTVRTPGGVEFHDDDGGGFPNPALALPLTETGIYEVEITTYSPGESGSYSISLADGMSGLSAASPGGVLSSVGLGGPPRPPAGTGMPIALGQPVQGTLGPGDETLFMDEFCDRYSFQGQTGQVLEIRAESTQFETYLIFRTPGGEEQFSGAGAFGLGSRSPGPGNATRMVAAVAEDGPHDIVVAGFSAGAMGPYTLTVSTGTLPANTSGGPIAVGQTVQGLLAPGDTVLDSGEYMDEYTLPVVAGQALSIRMSSTDFDTYLIFVDPSGAQQENDDFTGLNSGLDLVVSAPGNARIGASTYTEGSVGLYTLSVTSAGSAPAPPAAGAAPASGRAVAGLPPGSAIARGQTVRGQLIPGDTVLPEGMWLDHFTFFAQAGQAVTLTMDSTELTPYLILRQPGGAQTDAPAAGDGRATLTLTLPATGQCSIIATSQSPQERGNYSLTLQ